MIYATRCQQSSKFLPLGTDQSLRTNGIAFIVWGPALYEIEQQGSLADLDQSSQLSLNRVLLILQERMTSVWAGGMLLLIALPSVVSQNRRGDPLQPNWQGPELDGRENAQSRAWVPNNELPLPSSWTWNEYKSKLLEKDIGVPSDLPRRLLMEMLLGIANTSLSVCCKQTRAHISCP